MINENQAREVVGSTAYSSDNEKIGKIGQVFLDDETNRPEFLTVQHRPVRHERVVRPAADADVTGDGCACPSPRTR